MGDQQPDEVLGGVDVAEAAPGARQRSATTRPRLKGKVKSSQGNFEGCYKAQRSRAEV